MFDNRSADRRTTLAAAQRKQKLKFLAFILGTLLLFGGCAALNMQTASQCQAQGGVYESDDGECEFDEGDDD